MHQFSRNKSACSGFTLLEILLVIAAIAILAGIVIFAINPGKQLAELRNGKRRADVSLILNALYQYMIDHNGASLGAILLVADIANCTAQKDNNISICAQPGCGGVDLSILTENQKYLVIVPVDPAGDPRGDYWSGYSAWLSANNRVTVCATRAELGQVISVTR